MRNIKFIIASLALSIFVSACASLKKGSSSFDDSDSPYVAETTKPVVKETPAVVVKKEPAPTTNSAIVVKEERVKVVGQTETNVYKFYVIIGSYKVVDNANNFSKEISSKGFAPVILENEQALYRVSILGTNDETEARQKVGTIRQNYPSYSDVWLLVRKK